MGEYDSIAAVMGTYLLLLAIALGGLALSLLASLWDWWRKRRATRPNRRRAVRRRP